MWSEFIFAQVEQKVERLRQTEASLEKRIERERTEVLNTFCVFFFNSNSMLIQVRAAWEDLEARREEFLKEKKVLAHLGFY